MHVWGEGGELRLVESAAFKAEGGFEDLPEAITWLCCLMLVPISPVILRAVCLAVQNGHGCLFTIRLSLILLEGPWMFGLTNPLDIQLTRGTRGRGIAEKVMSLFCVSMLCMAVCLVGGLWC